MERTPRHRPIQAEFYESPLGKFEVKNLDKIASKDIEDADRAFIFTVSGNRYMLRHSKTRNGSLVIYNEREGNGFRNENGRPFLIEGDSIAKVGEPMRYFEITDEINKMGNWANSTAIVRIEIRKGFDAAIEKLVTEGRSVPETIDPAESMIDQIEGRKK
jgi:hypothetical protein